MYMHSSLSYILGCETIWGRNDKWDETTSGAKRLGGGGETTSWGRNDWGRKWLWGETSRIPIYYEKNQ